jgi:hypothetical protein
MGPVLDTAAGSAGERAQLLPRSVASQLHSPTKSSSSKLWAAAAARCGGAGVVRVLAAFSVAGGWMFVSSLLILVNKHILKDLKFG